MGSDTRAALAPFSLCRVGEIQPKPPDRLWLIEELWLDSGVGILGGAAKVCKTYLAAEISAAVATGTKLLQRFVVPSPGKVLFYGAEDSLCALRTRFETLAAIRGLALSELPIYLIDTPTLRLDQKNDLVRLCGAIEKCQPRLLVLDPFVRIARIDENSALEVSSVLASLRTIQRKYDLAVLIVHHARKSPAAHPNQALRGSSDFAAWSDSNLYLARRAQRIMLSVEHRNAPAPGPLALRLSTDPAPHLVLLDQKDPLPDAPTDPLQNEILQRLSLSSRAISTVEMREFLKRRKADVVAALEDLRALGRVERTARGWSLPAE